MEATHCTSGADADAVSQRESRALTAVAALRRLGLLADPPCGAAADVASPLRVTVAGADRNECVHSAAAAAALFAPLAAAAAAARVPALRLLLLGPAVPPRPPRAAHFTVTPAGKLRSLDDYSDYDASTVPAEAEPELELEMPLRVVMAHGLLCDASSAPVFAPGCSYDSDEDTPSTPPAAVFAFNAGVWGYRAWAHGIAACCAAQGAPVVVTAYRLEECAEDARALRRAGLALAWGPEANPFSSRAPWAPAGAPPDGVRRFENAAWLCAVPKDSRWAPLRRGESDSDDDDGSGSDESSDGASAS